MAPGHHSSHTLTLCVIVAVLAACSDSASDPPAPPELFSVPDGGRLLWKMDPEPLNHGYPQGNIQLSDGAVYTVVSGVLYALDVRTGDVQWEYDPGIKNGVVGPLAIKDGIVYIFVSEPGSGYLVAVDIQSRQEKWRCLTTNTPRGEPVIADGLVFVSCLFGSLQAVDATHGREIWRFVSPGAGVISQAVVMDGVVYCGSDTDSCYALDAATGAVTWRIFLSGGGNLPPIASEGIVCFGNDAREEYSNLYAIDADTHNILWEKRFQWWKHEQPTLSAGMLYYNHHTNLYAVDFRTGQERWSYDLVYDRIRLSPAIAQGKLYTFNTSALYAMDIGTGKALWKFGLPSIMSCGYAFANEASTSPVAEGATVFFGALDGYIYAITAE